MGSSLHRLHNRIHTPTTRKMTCYHPLPAYRKAGSTFIGDYRKITDATPTKLPCGGCLGCRTDNARAWALRCTLELNEHKSAAFSTLTYRDEDMPPTLNKEHLQYFLKRLRKRADRKPIQTKIKFFASGEYGEQTHRPHYHAILYGLNADRDRDAIEEEWRMGHVRTEYVTPQRIAYVAGYCQKKIGYKMERQEYINYVTGEYYEWQPPFIHMSRGGRHGEGIGGKARKYVQSWRAFAMLNGDRMSVPRYLHEAWKAVATEAERDALEYERYKLALTRDNSEARTRAAEHIAKAKQALRAAQRKLYS